MSRPAVTTDSLLKNSSANLATAEKYAAKLAANRKTNPPEYFNSLTGNTYSIDGVTEDSLILASAQSKQKAVGYCKQMANVGSISDDYNDLLKEFTESRQADSANIVAGLDQITGKFNEFRDDLQSQPGTASNVGSGFVPMLSAMVRSLGRLGLKDRRERFHSTFNNASKTQHLEDQTEDLKKELRSWIRVLVTYP